MTSDRKDTFCAERGREIEYRSILQKRQKACRMRQLPPDLCENPNMSKKS